VVVSRLAKDDHVGRVEMHGHDVELTFQATEVVGPAAGREGLCKEAFQRGIGEEACWQDRPKRGQEAEKGKIPRVAGVVAKGRRKGFGQFPEASGVLSHGRPKEHFGV